MKREPLKPMKFCSLFVIAILAITIFSPSCQEETEYHPSARFVLKGTVLSDPGNQPLEDILVIVFENRIVTISDKLDTILVPKASTVTNEDGKFIVSDSLAVPGALTYTLKFVDGYLPFKATGQIRDTFITKTFTDPIFINGDGHWYAGEFIKEIPFKLKIN